ncbi:hypothetical protein [Lactiplantibacillus plajomi]|uniref:Integral membrane protein n=1 Tax=Lactiplantibacillus plajomi TaxID=1457217 RepID=A0ABV6K444_9LACO|nr:hypothetical protein [Lactiplantibacillus plajomi]
MKPFPQPTILEHLGLVTGCWLLVQLLLLPSALGNDANSLHYLGIALIGLIFLITLIDAYRVYARQITRPYLAIDVLTLVAVSLLLLF